MQGKWSFFVAEAKKEQIEYYLVDRDVGHREQLVIKCTVLYNLDESSATEDDSTLSKEGLSERMFGLHRRTIFFFDNLFKDEKFNIIFKRQKTK